MSFSFCLLCCLVSLCISSLLLWRHPSGFSTLKNACVPTQLDQEFFSLVLVQFLASLSILSVSQCVIGITQDIFSHIPQCLWGASWGGGEGPVSPLDLLFSAEIIRQAAPLSQPRFPRLQSRSIDNCLMGFPAGRNPAEVLCSL